MISFSDLCYLLIDSKLLKIDNVDPQKVDKNIKIEKEWQGIRELLLTGLKSCLFN